MQDESIQTTPEAAMPDAPGEVADNGENNNNTVAGKAEKEETYQTKASLFAQPKELRESLKDLSKSFSELPGLGSNEMPMPHNIPSKEMLIQLESTCLAALRKIITTFPTREQKDLPGYIGSSKNLQKSHSTYSTALRTSLGSMGVHESKAETIAGQATYLSVSTDKRLEKTPSAPDMGKKAADHLEKSILPATDHRFLTNDNLINALTALLGCTYQLLEYRDKLDQLPNDATFPPDMGPGFPPVTHIIALFYQYVGVVGNICSERGGDETDPFDTDDDKIPMTTMLQKTLVDVERGKEPLKKKRKKKKKGLQRGESITHANDEDIDRTIDLINRALSGKLTNQCVTLSANQMKRFEYAAIMGKIERLTAGRYENQRATFQDRYAALNEMIELLHTSKQRSLEDQRVELSPEKRQDMDLNRMANLLEKSGRRRMENQEWASEKQRRGQALEKTANALEALSHTHTLSTQQRFTPSERKLKEMDLNHISKRLEQTNRQAEYGNQRAEHPRDRRMALFETLSLTIDRMMQRAPGMIDQRYERRGPRR